jgi:hypothetical protein
MNTGDEGAVAAALIYVGDQLNYVINAIDRAR